MIVEYKGRKKPQIPVYVTAAGDTAIECPECGGVTAQMSEVVVFAGETTIIDAKGTRVERSRPSDLRGPQIMVYVTCEGCGNPHRVVVSWHKGRVTIRQHEGGEPGNTFWRG